TPLFQRPLDLGADCVVYSATKHIDGQGRCLGGIILASEDFIQKNIHQLIRQTGPSMSPFNAWVLLKGLETLSVRVRRQTHSAANSASATGSCGSRSGSSIPTILSRISSPRLRRYKAGLARHGEHRVQRQFEMAMSTIIKTKCGSLSSFC